MFIVTEYAALNGTDAKYMYILSTKLSQLQLLYLCSLITK